MPETDKAVSDPGVTYRRLYRSRRQRVIAGVCGGLAEYFNIDVAILRVLWILFTLLGGTGVLAYLICWIIVPVQDDGSVEPSRRDSSGLVVGVILLVIGVAALSGWMSFGMTLLPVGFVWTIFPFFAVVLALGLLIGWVLSKSSSPPQPYASPQEKTTAENGSASKTENEPSPPPSRAYRSRQYRIIAGVCGGLGQYFNLDPTIVRILWILFAFASLGLAVLIYIILIFVLPEEPY